MLTTPLFALESKFVLNREALTVLCSVVKHLGIRSCYSIQEV